MAARTDKTSFATSGNLKTELNLKSAYPALEVGHVVYDGAANDVHLLTLDYSDGSFRTVNIVGTVTSFDLINGNDAVVVRSWMERELNILIGNWPGIEGAACTLNSGTWTCVITHLGVQYTSTDTSKPDSMSKAFIKVLKAT